MQRIGHVQQKVFVQAHQCYLMECTTEEEYIMFTLGFAELKLSNEALDADRLKIYELPHGSDNLSSEQLQSHRLALANRPGRLAKAPVNLEGRARPAPKMVCPRSTSLAGHDLGAATCQFAYCLERGKGS